MPEDENYDIQQVVAEKPGDNEMLLKTLWLSLDPYMRGRMNDAKSYAKPLDIGEVITAGVVSQVVSQVVKNAPARELGGGGWEPGTAAREAAEAMESWWSVARGKSRRNGKDHCSKQGSGWRARDGFSGSSRLTPAQPHASTLGASQVGLLH